MGAHSLQDGACMTQLLNIAQTENQCYAKKMNRNLQNLCSPSVGGKQKDCIQLQNDSFIWKRIFLSHLQLCLKHNHLQFHVFFPFQSFFFFNKLKWQVLHAIPHQPHKFSSSTEKKDQHTTTTKKKNPLEVKMKLLGKGRLEKPQREAMYTVCGCIVQYMKFLILKQHAVFCIAHY